MMGRISERRQFMWTFVTVLVATLFRGQVSSFTTPFGSVLRQRNHENRLSVPSANHERSLSTSASTCSALHVSVGPSSSSASSSEVGRDDSRVVFQKVVKSPIDASGNSNPLFLGQLVEYLQDYFELPDDLPMVYQSMPLPDDDDDNNNDDSSSKKCMCIQRWDSPMSPSPEATCLDAEVVAIYTKNTGSNSSSTDGDDDNTKGGGLPTMAMVAVRKSSRVAPRPPSPMAQNLFDDSERRILRALDRGLDKFAAGKVPVNLDGTNKAREVQNMQAAQEAMIEEMLDDAADDHPSVPKGSNNKNAKIVDAEYTKVAAEPVPQQSKAKKANTVSSTPAGIASEDFAVKAAAKAASMQKKKETSSTRPKSLDFAVEQARKLASKKKQQTNSKPAAATAAKKQSPASTKNAPVQEISSASKPPALKIERDDGRSFRTVVSTPESHKERAKQRLEQSSKQKAATKSTASKEKKVKRTTAKTQQTAKKEPSSSAKGSATKTPKINVGSKKESDPASPKLDENMPSDQEIQQTASEIMEEMANQGTDMTPEELLQDVLKFGESQEKENQVGSGFVSAAFDKAKELLREQKKQREEILKAKVVDQVTKEMQQPAQGGDNNPATNVRTKVVSSEEEELRQMFAAGEQLADGRITMAPSNGELAKPTADDEQVIDELIASDKTVSDYARVLDDELAELEVRINQAPGEELDAPGQHPVFDVFSGPEVYDRNVDPATAVNWPGALPGTNNNVRLPKELNEVVKQASFAVEVLQSLEERQAPGSSETEYFVGDQQMTQQQVSSLQAVANEAIELGIIPSPLMLMEERAKLQMLVDELWNQPDDRTREILSNFKDLLLSDNFVALVRERLEAMAERDLESMREHIDDEEGEGDTALEERHVRERELLGQLVVSAQLLLKEARALGAELEAQQIEVIRSICKVAMDPSHTTEQDTANALADSVREMRPLFDDCFIAYLKYAIGEEEGRLARAGLMDDPEHSHWLYVLKIVQQGVHAEVAKGLNRYIEHVWYVLRMETPLERKMLLSKLIDDMPTLDVRPFVRVVGNIVGSLGEAAKGEFDGVGELGSMTNKLLQLHRDTKELLPPDRIDEMSRDADEWAAKKRERMLEQRRLTKQRLKASRDTEEYDEEIENIFRRGETENFAE